MNEAPVPQIGTVGESSLHAALKGWYGRSQEQFEVEVAGYVIDVVRGDLLIEIQTGNFAAMKVKLARLLPDHPVRLVYPVPQEKWIVRETAVGERISRRKSPKRGQMADVFAELVRIPHLLPHPNLSLELLLTGQEEVWRNDGRGSWRRKRWSIYDRRLLAVFDSAVFQAPADLLALLPANLPQPFSNRELAAAINGRLRLAQQMTYTLHRVGLLAVSGKQGNAILYNVLAAGVEQFVKRKT